MAFGENLKLIRQERNITQEQLAEILEVSRQAISKWESGNGYPETEKLITIAKKLNVSLDYLLLDQSNVEEKESNENKTIVYAPSGKIAIPTFDKKSIINCQAVKSSNVIGNGKGPKYVLLGVDHVGFFGEHTTILGWYKTVEAIEAEITDINLAIQQGKLQYELKHFTKVEFKGLFGQPHIVE